MRRRKMSTASQTSAPAPMAPAPAPAPTPEVETVEVKKPKKALVRLLSLLPLVLCVALLLLSVSVFTGAWTVESQSMLNTVKAMLGSGEKAFGILPVLFNAEETAALIANLLVYVLLVAILVSVILSIVALISGKACCVRTALGFVTCGALVYLVAFYAISAAKATAALDTMVAAIAGVGVVITFFMNLKKLGKKGWLWLLNTVLTLVVAVVATAAFAAAKTFDGTYALAALAVCVLLLMNAIVTYARSKMGVLRGVINLVLAIAILALCFVAKDLKIDMMLAIVALAVALLHFIVLLIVNRKPKVVEVEEAEDPLAGFAREEYVEAYAYDGGPVAGVELAEEVFPTLSAISAQKDPTGAAQNTVASLLGNGFDAFLITLNEKEKGEFIDLYVLKCKGIMPEIPGYVVGGDNKDFFNKVFIYLGQYREKIPADLLSKMYQFSMKI